VEKIKHTVRTQRTHYNPQIEFEAQHGGDEEDQDDNRFDAEDPGGTPNDGEQGVVRGDDDGQSGIKHPVAVKAQQGGEQTDRQRQTGTYRVRHRILLRVLT